MHYNFCLEDKTKILDRFGADFYTNTERLINSFILKWSINEIQLINSFSANLVFKCFSTTYGSVVIKFGSNNYEFESEINALSYLNKECTSELIDYDLENNILLQECICPGDELVLVKSLKTRIDVFCELFNKLHNSGNKSNKKYKAFEYKSYSDWIMKITSYMNHQDIWKEVSLHMNRAKGLFIDVSHKYDSNSLLHGDFHYYNILKSENGYKVIDPKGVIGNPIFDIPRYILNEFWDEDNRVKVDDKIERVFSMVCDRLKVSKEILSKLLYIEGSMAICWNIQDGADISEKKKYLRMLEKLYGYVKIHNKIS